MTVSVFISWSGKRSQKVAEKLRTWLKKVIPAVNPLMSKDVKSGKPFFNELNRLLKRADFAVLCLSSENWGEPWIAYEAGAVFGKTEKTTEVCPYLIGSNRGDLPQPLVFFQGCKNTRDETYQLVESINEAAGKPLTGPKLKKAFNKNWPELERFFKRIGAPKKPIDVRAMINDFREASLYIDMHRAQLEGPFHRLIDNTIEAFKSGAYKRETTVNLAYKAVEKSKNTFRTKKSLLIGNVRDFFKKHFTKKELREVIIDLESILTPDPDETRKRLTDRMLRALLEVFSRFHRILLDKLDEHLKAADANR
jgi:hypothetical protein